MLHYTFDWSILVTQPYMAIIAKGMVYTLLVTSCSSILSLILGSAIAILRVSRSKIGRHIGNAYVEIVRNVPGLFWILFFYFALPDLLPTALGAHLHTWEHYALAAGIIGLTIDNAAYLSDIFRGGMLAVPPGQREAAASCGFSSLQEYYWVVCPQTLRSVLPAVSNRMVHNFKNSSLCMAISLQELTWATQQIESITFKGLEVTAVATAFYSLGSLVLALIAARIFGHPGAKGICNTEDHGLARAY